MTKRKWPDKKRKTLSRSKQRTIEELSNSELQQLLRLIKLKKEQQEYDRARKRKRKSRVWPKRPLS